MLIPLPPSPPNYLRDGIYGCNNSLYIHFLSLKNICLNVHSQTSPAEPLRKPCSKHPHTCWITRVHSIFFQSKILLLAAAFRVARLCVTRWDVNKQNTLFSIAWWKKDQKLKICEWDVLRVKNWGEINFLHSLLSFDLFKF